MIRLARALLFLAGMMVVYDTDSMAALDWEMDSTDEEIEIEVPFDDPDDGDTLEWDGAAWVVVNE